MKIRIRKISSRNRFRMSICRFSSSSIRHRSNSCTCSRMVISSRMPLRVSVSCKDLNRILKVMALKKLRMAQGEAAATRKLCHISRHNHIVDRAWHQALRLQVLVKSSTPRRALTDAARFRHQIPQEAVHITLMKRTRRKSKIVQGWLQAMKQGLVRSKHQYITKLKPRT